MFSQLVELQFHGVSRNDLLLSFFSNHGESIAFHEICRECVCGLDQWFIIYKKIRGVVTNKKPTKVFEDNLVSKMTKQSIFLQKIIS